MTSDNSDQAEYWGQSPSGAKWISYEHRLDTALAPVLDLVLDRAALAPGDHVLDIGCGTGISLLMAARQVGPTGSVLGVDISQQLLQRAETRIANSGLGNIDTLLDDAQTTGFEPASRYAMISRFGMMFFADPVSAFRNIASALKPGGRMTFAAWGPLEGNPWFRVPHIRAVERMGPMPKTDRNAPGPLAFHDGDRITGLMAEAGLTDVSVDAVHLDLTPMGGLTGAAALVTQVGPAARILAHHAGTAEDAQAIEVAVATDFATYETPERMVIPALINLFQARVPV
ncbi:MAG: methyltransferase domain-containing protein [Rhodobacteraceae bacterium]|nr:methyltransferase domain-containing protein [Paracoccaceae bacterium]